MSLSRITVNTVRHSILCSVPYLYLVYSVGDSLAKWVTSCYYFRMRHLHLVCCVLVCTTYVVACTKEER